MLKFLSALTSFTLVLGLFGSISMGIACALITEAQAWESWTCKIFNKKIGWGATVFLIALCVLSFAAKTFLWTYTGGPACGR